MKIETNLNDVQDECQKFPARFQSLHLATCNAAGEPEASYAPYVEHAGDYYVYVSELAAHTDNLATTGRCSVLFIESEQEAAHLFARRRLTLRCSAHRCQRGSAEFEAIIELFVEKFGGFMQMMRQLRDFHLYQLRPASGAYVAGFAQAYTLEGDGLSQIKQRSEQGHRRQEMPSTTDAAAAEMAADAVQTALPYSLADICQRFTSLRRTSKARHRDIAQQLGITEGELIAAHVAAPSDDAKFILRAVRLRADWPAMMAALQSLGQVMALTRNASCVHEKIGVYRNISQHKQIGLVLGGEIELRLFYQHWAYGFGVMEQSEQGEQRSLQFFDAQGTAIHKIFLRQESDMAAYTNLVAQFADAQQGAGMLVRPALANAAELADNLIDVPGFRRAWDGLRDTHDFHDLLNRFAVTRIQALRLAEAKYVQQVELDACQSLLQAAAAEGGALMVFVGNAGMIQIHSGPISKVVQMGPWLNVLDAGFNLHLREDHIASAWVVKKPTVDGLVTSLELFDAQGNTIALFFGQRKPGKRELCEWRALLENIQQEASSCPA